MPHSPGQMPPVDRHVLVCTAEPCADHGAEAVYKALKKKIKRVAGLENSYVIRSGSVGGCQHGPMVVIYPEGVWYHSITLDKIDRLITEHLLNGQVIEDWRFHQTLGCPCPKAAQPPQ